MERLNDEVTVEFFGIARLRAGVARFQVSAATACEALQACAEAFPALGEGVVRAGWVEPAFRINLNGDRFLDDPATPLTAGDVLILISADVGG